MNIAGKIEKLVKKSLEKQGVEISDLEITVEIPKDSSNGHYSTNIAMKLSSILKDNPLNIANKIVEGMEEDIDIERVEVAQPGFINIFLSNRYFLSEISKISQRGNEYLQQDLYKDKKIVIEYTDANPFKEMHIGHLYSNNVGESFARLLEALGANVQRACYQGDIGLHVAKSIWGLEKKLLEDGISFEKLEELSLTEKVKYLGEAYALGAHHYDDLEEESVKAEIDEINYYIFSLFSKTLEKRDFSDFEKRKISKMYKKGREWCLEYFETIYQKVGTKFDHYFFESEVGDMGLDIVLKNVGKVFEKDDGAIIYRADESKNLHTRVFVNKYGIPTYEAKEIGLAVKKNKDLEYDESLVVTADEQSGYFRVVFDALSNIEPDITAKTKHFAHGKVKLPGAKKMSSRKGGILSAEWLIGQTQVRVKDLMKQNSKYQGNDLEELSLRIAISAIKYAFLKVGVGRDIVFDFDQSINFDGNTGPYLLYVYTRCVSILKDANFENPKNLCFDSCLENPYTKDLVLILSKYRGAVLDSSTNYSPSTLCQYLFDLGQSFNSFYQNVRVLDASDEEKQVLLLIVKAVSIVMKDGLEKLGIDTVEKM
jgi:arginyl-tRNA synthetase